MSSDLKTVVITFNCGRELTDAERFAENLVKSVEWPTSPDVIFLSLQEVAPIAYSFLGGSFLRPFLARYSQAIRIAAQTWLSQEDHYIPLEVRNIGMTAFILFVRSDCIQRIRWVETGSTGVGWYAMGNKGCTALRIGYSHAEQTIPITFLAAHFAPGEKNLGKRNEDWQRIVEDIQFVRNRAATAKTQRPESSGEGESEPLLSERETMNDGIYGSGSYVFIAGDLNYRTSDVSPTAADSATFPQPKKLHDIAGFEDLLSKDQLKKEITAVRSLHGFQEAVIGFPPTYKYSKAAREAAARSPQAVYSNDKPVWASWRWPSWCDRILLLDEAAPAEESIELFDPHYAALPLLPTSDHQPVSLYCALKLDRIGTTSGSLPIRTMAPPYNLKSDSLQRRAMARRAEIVCGVAAYFGWTWEGNALVLATLLGAWGGWVLVQGAMDW